MWKFVTLVGLAFLIVACNKNDAVKMADKPASVFTDPNWIQIKVPKAGEIYAVSGNIDVTLLISTLGKVLLYTTDQGNSWQKSPIDNRAVIFGFLKSRDTVYAFVSSSYDNKTNRKIAKSSEYYSLNQGLTWSYSLNKNSEKVTDVGVATGKNGAVFELNYRYGSGINSSYSIKSQITKTKFGLTSLFETPIAEQPLNLYIDRLDRLYVTTSGGTFNDDGYFLGHTSTSDVYLYVSKKAVE